VTLAKEAVACSGLDRLALSKAAWSRTVKTTLEITKKTLEGGEDLLMDGSGF
jgi:hypothetical protein